MSRAFSPSCRDRTCRLAWHQRTGYLPITRAAFELTRAQGFYRPQSGHFDLDRADHQQAADRKFKRAAPRVVRAHTRGDRRGARGGICRQGNRRRKRSKAPSAVATSCCANSRMRAAERGGRVRGMETLMAGQARPSQDRQFKRRQFKRPPTPAKRLSASPFRAGTPAFPSRRRGSSPPSAPSRRRAPRSGARARARRRTRRPAPRA